MAGLNPLPHPPLKKGVLAGCLCVCVFTIFKRLSQGVLIGEEEKKEESGKHTQTHRVGDRVYNCIRRIR